MAGNHVLLETISLTQTAASVVFDNIPQTGYSDLKIVASTRGAQSGIAEANRIRFNGDTTNTNYTGKRLLSSGSAVSSDQTTTITPGFFNNLSSSTANTFSNSEVYIPDYLSSNSKSYSVDTVTENNATEAYMAFVAGRWSGTAAISSITFVPESGNSYVAGSTFNLYGVAATGTTPATAPKATGGNIVANDGTYWYHAFLSSGNFVPQTSLTCNILQVAGGGGGGLDTNGAAGGGGAGGLLAFTSQSLTNQNYSVVIGAGGTGSSTHNTTGTNGSNSQFAALTASVGGGGGSARTNANNGGSGGGTGDGTNGSQWTPGSPTTGQGYAGGYAPLTSSGAGGGGGAGAAGANSVAGSSAAGGAGGAGINTYSTWHTATNTGVSGYIAGGGGGGSYNAAAGAGGAGGGGRGASPSTTLPSVDGTTNTGSGGGGGSRLSNNPAYVGGNGGSGIVIIRYPMA